MTCSCSPILRMYKIITPCLARCIFLVPAFVAIFKNMSEELTQDQIALLKNAFDTFDVEKKGSIGTVMIGTILGMLGIQTTEKMLSEIIAEVDEDGSGELEFAEFITLASRFMGEEESEAMEAELKEAFRLYDKEGNGYITTDVLREILRELDSNLTKEELDMMIQEIDSDGSGTVDFDVLKSPRSLNRRIHSQEVLEENNIGMEDLDKEQVLMLRSTFDTFDVERKGYIPTEMIGSIMDMLGNPLTEDELDNIISEIDEDGNGEVNFEEFANLAARFLVEDDEDTEAIQSELKGAFRMYDKEGNGFITTQVLREILKELDDKLTENDLENMIEEIDTDGSGTVDWEEFKAVMIG